MKIEGAVISCYRHDMHLTRLCVASIRQWYPSLPVWLLKDRHYGDFDTREIEKHWDAREYPAKQRNLGWGWGKVDVLTDLPPRRLLVLDSDIVLVGRVLDRLEQFDEDFIVNEESYSSADIERLFFALGPLHLLDPGFEFNGIGFNTGQVVATTGCIRREDFSGFVDWEIRMVKRPDVFKMGDQGLTNYIVQRQAQRGQLTIRREPFMVWPGNEMNTMHIRVENLTADGGYPELIHWAGLRWGKTVRQMPRADILRHFEDLYYSRVPHGPWLRRRREVASMIKVATHWPRLKGVSVAVRRAVGPPR